MNEATPSQSTSSFQRGQDISLRDVALVFLKLGTIAFGGPAAHIAMMEDEFVSRRQWLTHEEFLDRLAAANLLPGPSSTEMAIFIGYEKRGWKGLLVAGCCFILPAAIMVAAIAAAYVRYGKLPQVNGIFYALKPVVIAIVIQAIWKLGRAAVKTKWLAAVALISALLYALRVHETLVLAIAAALGALPLLAHRFHTAGHFPAALALVFAPLRANAAMSPTAFSMGRLFLVFAKIGAILFGSGYVLLAFLRTDLVDRLHWLTERQLLDAVAVGQITPGPVFTTATFIGYLIGGGRGATVATVGIFAPAFFFVALSGFIIPKIRRSKMAAAMLDGVVAGSLALMAVVAWQLGRAAIIDIPTGAIAVASAALLLVWRVNSIWLIVAAGVFGFVFRGGALH